MVSHKNHAPYPFSHAPKFKKSLLAMCVMALSSPSFSQEPAAAGEGSIEEIVVSGVRSSLENAQDIKRNADTFVDSISSKDIGSLPDRSVLEAMQRLPGVSIERFAASEDPDHFGVEGSGAVIRGMTATRSEFNGRDSFTANSGRGLSFQDVPPELMGGVDIYKNQSADMIEGGIGGTVSLRTRKPFDSPDRVIAISGDISYGDMAEEESPTISALFSDRWETAAGEFGFLVNLAHSELKGASHGIQSDAFLEYDATDFAVAEGFDTVWVPNGSNFFMKNDDRTRKGYAAAFQWENTDQTILTTAQFMRSDARLSWTENAVKYQGDAYGGERQIAVLDGTEFTFSDDGVFGSGTMVHEASGGWRGGYAPGDAQFGNKFQMDTRYKDTRTVVDDYAFNIKFTPNDQWEYELDLQYIEAETSDDDLQIALGQWALQTFDTTGDTPTLVLQDPFSTRREAEPDWFQNPENYWWRSAMDHYERSEGESFATRADVKYNFDDDAGLLKSVKFGARFAEREQTVRSTSYNWGTIGAEWKAAVYLNDPLVADQEYEFVDFSDFHRGGVLTVDGGGFLFPSESLVRDVVKGQRELYNSAPDNDPWIPYPQREDLVSHGIFQAPEVYNTTETNKAAYVRLDFGSDEMALRFNGNIGLRYVELEREAMGSVMYPDLVGIPYPEDAPTDLTDYEAIYAWGEQAVADDRYPTVQDAIAYARDSKNWLTAEERAFGNDAFTLEQAIDEYSGLLPSLNLKLEMTDDLIARFAVSKAIALPDMSEVKNQAVLGSRQLAVTYVPEDELPPDAPPPSDVGGEDENSDEGRDIESVAPVLWEGSGGNPYLQPMESVQYDASLEWYFASVGSFTTSIFYKDLSNTFVTGAFPRSFTNPVTGQTQAVEFTTTVNGGDGYMQGFELAYQQFYDMLPAPWDGLGLQVNYTYIDSGLQNSALSGLVEPVTDLEGEEDRYPLPDISALPLKGVSDHTFNIVGMYEKNDWSVRLAYNWRSKYLLTTRDVISKYPLWNDDAGFLDGSIFYNVNDNITVGLQLTNILDTQTKTIMILDNEGTEASRSWFVNDRRAALIVRATF
jgi:iron complex outermembrane recepter protein